MVTQAGPQYGRDIPPEPFMAVHQSRQQRTLQKQQQLHARLPAVLQEIDPEEEDDDEESRVRYGGQPAA